MTGRRLSLSISLFLALFTLSAEAETHWTATVEGVVLSPANDRVSFSFHDGGGSASYRIDGEGGGFNIGLRVRSSPRLVFELGAGLVNLDVELTVLTSEGPLRSTESATYEQYFAGIGWHILPNSSWDPSFGLFVAQSKLDDVIFENVVVPRKFTFDDDYGFGVSARADRALDTQGRWRLVGSARILRTILESDSSAGDVDLDPITISVGIGYRFGH